MSSETSSEININYLDNNGNKLSSNGNSDGKRPSSSGGKRQSSDTDFYFDMVANQNKVIIKESEESSESKASIKSSSKSKDSSSSRSRSSSSSSSKVSSIPKTEKINVSEEKKTAPVQFSGKSEVNQYSTKIGPTNTQSKTLPPLEPTINTSTLNPSEIRMKKIELLRRLCEIKTKGFQLTKEYDFNSSIEEMEYEYALLKSFADKRNGIKLYKSFLLNGVSLVEFLNDKYDPFDFQLNGWSEHISVEVDSYDDVLEELYEKYKTSGGSWPPELKLMMLIIGSGAGYHFTKTQLGSSANINTGSFLNKMMSNPNKKQSQFMSAQEVNLENQKKIIKEKDQQIKELQKEKILQTNKTSQPNITQPNITQPTIHRSNTRDGPEIRAPENVQEILDRIKNIQQKNNINSVNTTETQDETTTNNDRILSDATISTNDIRKKARKPPKKQGISIPI